MKKGILATIIFTIFCTLFSQAQDIINKRDGSKIESKVVEITATTIKYKKYNQLEGPIRVIEISEVMDIIYENGTSEKFELKPVTIPTKPTSVKERIAEPEKDHIHGNGFFIEGMFGFSSTTTTVNPYSPGGSYSYEQSLAEASIQMRLGSKWYFGSIEKKWRPGVQLTFLRIAIYHNFGFPGSYSLSPFNLGFANVFKFSEKTGLEINANFGFNVMNFVPPVPGGYSDWSGDGGIIYGAEVKYRYKSFAVGLDYSCINTFDNGSKRNLVSLSVGRKF